MIFIKDSIGNNQIHVLQVLKQQEVQLMRTGKRVKRHLALILSVLLTVTAIPQFAAATAKVRKTKVTLKSVKAGKGRMTVKWKANKAVFGGYQI